MDVKVKKETVLDDAVTDDGLWIRSRWYVGVDLGQAYDPTAVCIIEEPYPTIPPYAWGHGLAAAEENIKKFETLYTVRHLERLPLHMEYPDQVAYIADLLSRKPLVDPDVYLDYTGVGRPVFDLFKQARIPRIRGISITAGREAVKTDSGWSVPKALLVQKVQALMHTGQLIIADSLKDAPAMMKELHDFRASYTSAGNPVFNARSGSHDDLVLALSMAVFGASQPRPLTKLNITWAL